LLLLVKVYELLLV